MRLIGPEHEGLLGSSVDHVGAPPPFNIAFSRFWLRIAKRSPVDAKSFELIVHPLGRCTAIPIAACATGIVWIASGGATAPVHEFMAEICADVGGSSEAPKSWPISRLLPLEHIPFRPAPEPRGS